MTFTWPEAFERVPEDPWVDQSVEALALNYDTVENHGWYSNLDYTVEQVGEYVHHLGAKRLMARPSLFLDS
jgi:hypothetical protein